LTFLNTFNEYQNGLLIVITATMLPAVAHYTSWTCYLLSLDQLSSFAMGGFCGWSLKQSSSPH